MKRRTTTRILLCVLTVVLLAGSIVILTGFNPFQQGISPRITKALDLTDEQVAKIKAKKLEAQKAQIEIRAKIKIAELELKDALDKDEVDLDA
ncbi:hypothetical protein J7M23_09445, partial [Candidatus Sumerlaeota bacterium]|nr:hypothetical protein [Candidatus Sumerlaeota bacterium]